MFPVTRLAAKATKLERRTFKFMSNVGKKVGVDTSGYTRELCEEMNKDSGIQKLNLNFIPYSKNIFKRAVIWVKSFVAKYKAFNNYIKERTNEMKENYKELFTKKREKKVRKIIINSLKQSLNQVSEQLNGEMKEIKNTIKASKK